ncbi:MAG: GNAT family N-acetyltransferase [Actinobacteria bacterium]|nr:GNAT family N-acetyltransferase [Actinomycetota bacterium]
MFLVARKVGRPAPRKEKNYKFRIAGKKDFNKCFDLYADLHKGNNLNKLRKLVFTVSGGKTIIVAMQCDCNGKEIMLAGVDMYYINDRDARENTIHEGFIGVAPEFEGNGLATEMRAFASKVFQGAGVSGISSRISEDNVGSLKSARRQGFCVVEKYFDQTDKKYRYYMKKTF